MRIGITNLKGGVGKTTISINLAVCFAHMGYRVCIVDTDTNQSSLKWYGARDESLPEVLAIGATDAKALNKAVDKLHKDHDIIIIDGTPSLSETTIPQIEICNKHKPNPQACKEQKAAGSSFWQLERHYPQKK